MRCNLPVIFHAGRLNAWKYKADMLLDYQKTIINGLSSESTNYHIHFTPPCLPANGYCRSQRDITELGSGQSPVYDNRYPYPWQYRNPAFHEKLLELPLFDEVDNVPPAQESLGLHAARPYQLDFCAPFVLSCFTGSRFPQRPTYPDLMQNGWADLVFGGKMNIDTQELADAPRIQLIAGDWLRPAEPTFYPISDGYYYEHPTPGTEAGMASLNYAYSDGRGTSIIENGESPLYSRVISKLSDNPIGATCDLFLAYTPDGWKSAGWWAFTNFVSCNGIIATTRIKTDQFGNETVSEETSGIGGRWELTGPGVIRIPEESWTDGPNFDDVCGNHYALMRALAGFRRDVSITVEYKASAVQIAEQEFFSGTGTIEAEANFGLGMICGELIP